MTSLLIKDILKTQIENSDKVYADGIEKLKEYLTDKVWDAVDAAGPSARKFALALTDKIKENEGNNPSIAIVEEIYSDGEFELDYRYRSTKMFLTILNVEPEIRILFNTCLSLVGQEKMNSDLGEFEFTLYSRGKILLSTKFSNPYLELNYSNNNSKILISEI